MEFLLISKRFANHHCAARDDEMLQCRRSNKTAPTGAVCVSLRTASVLDERLLALVLDGRHQHDHQQQRG
ncbi:MAG TPA: hypothetical protein PK441_02370, partial [Burkholderiaceae bacterium]|nr:hypothetical protein [Burkholderiaceae bacterium]